VAAQGEGVQATRVAVQLHSRLLRDVVAAYLATRPEFSVVGRVADRDGLVTLCELRHPDVVLLDAEGRVAEAIDTFRVLRARFPAVQVVLMYDRLSPNQLTSACEAGATSLIPAARGLDALVAMLQRGPDSMPEPRYDGLAVTGRELEIIVLMGSGHSVPEIAAQLGISPRTVENHKRRIYAKLGARSAVHAVSQAMTLGMLDEPVRVQPSRCTGEAGRATLVVVGGQAGAAFDQVAQVLVSNKLSFVREHVLQPLAREDWVRSHRGPITSVLVDPVPANWETPRSLGAPTIIVHSSPLERAAVMEALRRGADGIIPAGKTADQLVPAIQLVTQGYIALEAAHVRPLIDAVHTGFTEDLPSLPELSAREYDILRSIAAGDSVRQTARSLGIATKTVENTQARLFRKLGVRNRPGALAMAHALGLLPATEPIAVQAPLVIGAEEPGPPAGDAPVQTRQQRLANLSSL
jgi:DNA-binding NarL/FixJ family response regulator